MADRDEYLEKLRAQVLAWEKQMVDWEDATRSATREAKIELEKQVGIMRSRLDDMAYRMELLGSASQEAWHEIARGADDARKAMHDAFEKARSRLKDV
jgi:hypothetical protein